MSSPGWPAVVFTLQRGVRTAVELARITGFSENGIHKTLLLLEAEGLVYRLPNESRIGRGRNADRWKWNPDA